MPLVTEGVHVAHDRVADLVVGFGKDVYRPDISHLVHGGHERDVGVGHGRDAVGPHTASDYHVFGFDGSLVGDHCFNLATTVGPGCVVGDEIEHFGVGKDLAVSFFDGLFAHYGAGFEGVDYRDRGAVEATEDHLGVDVGH